MTIEVGGEPWNAGPEGQFGSMFSLKCKKELLPAFQSEAIPSGIYLGDQNLLKSIKNYFKNNEFCFLYLDTLVFTFLHSPWLCPVLTEDITGCVMSRTGVSIGCEPPFGYLELNPGPLEEEPMFLTSELSFQPQGKQHFLNWGPLHENTWGQGQVLHTY